MFIEINAGILFSTVLILCISNGILYYQLRAVTKEHAKKLKSLKNDVQALLLCARGVGEKLHLQQTEFRNLQDRQDKLELYDGVGDVSYQQVLALMNHGASADEMVESCDLTQGEVELLAHLQKSHKKPGNQNRSLVA